MSEVKGENKKNAAGEERGQSYKLESEDAPKGMKDGEDQKGGRGQTTSIQEEKKHEMLTRNRVEPRAAKKGLPMRTGEQAQQGKRRRQEETKGDVLC